MMIVCAGCTCATRSGVEKKHADSPPPSCDSGDLLPYPTPPFSLASCRLLTLLDELAVLRRKDFVWAIRPSTLIASKRCQW